MKRNIYMLPYAVIIAAGFYLIPFLISNESSAMLAMMGAIPFTSMVTAFFCGRRHGFSIPFAILCGLLFLPTLSFHFNYTAWIYAPFYGFLVLTGSFFGNLFKAE